MITEEVYRKKVHAVNAKMSVYKEVDDYLNQRQESLRHEAEVLQANVCADKLSREDYITITDNLAKALAFLQIQNRLRNEYIKMMNEYDRFCRLYEIQSKGK